MNGVRRGMALGAVVTGCLVAIGALPLTAATASSTSIATIPVIGSPPVIAPPATPTTTAAPAAPTTTAPPTTTDPFLPVPPQGAASASVSIVDFGFSPATITVNTGTTVTWTNTGASIHSVTSDTGAFDSSPSCPTGPCISPGSSFSHLFGQAGQFSYHCRVHPNMTGTVIVNSSAPATTTTTRPNPGTTTVSAGGTPNPTVAPPATGPQLAFTGASSNEAWLALGALAMITLGFALRPRRRPFPAVAGADRSGRHRSSPDST